MRAHKLKGVHVSDIVLASILTLWAILVILPFLNVIMISFATEREYVQARVFLFPMMPTLQNYEQLFLDGRVLIGYKNTLTIIAIGIPLSMFCTVSYAYGSSRPGFPGRRFFFFLILFTMLFAGGTIPSYLLMRDLGLTNTLWSVIFSGTVNTFNVIIMRNFFMALPEGLIESAKLDGAGEWRILFNLVLPLSMPIIATITLFYTVGRWNEWFQSMLYLHRAALQTLQNVLRSIVIDARVETSLLNESIMYDRANFSMGLQTATIMVTMLPVMLVFPFLQKHFTKGVLTGAIKE